MKSMDELRRSMRLEELRRRIAQYAEEIAQLFTPPALVTVVARNPQLDDGDAVVTADDLDAVVAAIHRLANHPVDTKVFQPDVPDYNPNPPAPNPFNPRDRALIPDVLVESLLRYAGEQRVPTGAFLRACLENDLAGACGRAHAESLPAIPAIVAFIYNELPSPCWGSKNKVNRWLKRQEIESESEPEPIEKGEA